jgi:dTDP-4-dehydrorhamnose reductase
MMVLVLGSSGQLATHLRTLLPEATFWGRTSLDLAEPTRVTAALTAVRPSAVVNAAGYTAVDQAEREPALAWRINAESVAAAALAAAELDVPFVHVSTDYVFDGRKESEYAEDDAPNPLNVYGATKLAGELAARTLCKKSWILRTSWLFSEHGSNFVKTMLRLAASGDELRVVADQRGRPTYAGDVAALIAAMMRQPGLEERLPYGTYHAVGGPIVSWHKFAEKIIEQAIAYQMLPIGTAVHAVATTDYSTPARRPPNSCLRPSAPLEHAAGIVMDWRRGLAEALGKLHA